MGVNVTNSSLPALLIYLVENANFSSAQCYSRQNDWPPEELEQWPHGYQCVMKTVSEFTQGDIFANQTYVCGKDKCECCWKLMVAPPITTNTT